MRINIVFSVLKQNNAVRIDYWEKKGIKRENTRQKTGKKQAEKIMIGESVLKSYQSYFFLVTEDFRGLRKARK